MVKVNQNRSNPFPKKLSTTLIWLVFITYLVYLINSFGLEWTRIVEGLSYANTLIERMMPPNFSRWELLLDGLWESIEISVIASSLGIFLSLFFVSPLLNILNYQLKN